METPPFTPIKRVLEECSPALVGKWVWDTRHDDSYSCFRVETLITDEDAKHAAIAKYDNSHSTRIAVMGLNHMHELVGKLIDLTGKANDAGLLTKKELVDIALLLKKMADPKDGVLEGKRLDRANKCLKELDEWEPVSATNDELKRIAGEG